MHDLFFRATRSLAAMALCASSVFAQAQLRLPSMPSLPSVPSFPALPAPSQVAPVLRREAAPVAELVQQRRQRIAELLRRRADLLEADAAGEPIVRGDLLVTAPTPALLDAARAAGFTLAREQRLDGLDMRLVVLRAPPGWDTARALRRLREIDPQADVDFNHLYLDSGDVAAPVASDAPASTAGVRTPAAVTSPAVKIGLIDGGVETLHPLLRDATVRAWGCRSTKVPSAHGTAVASLLVGHAEGFRGAAPAKAVLYAADVYCNDPLGGSVEAVAAALGWLAAEQVPVVNISLVGPPNRTLEQVVHRASAKGMLLVAAVGNDGPAAAPLYPAAYAGVVAVTAVDARGQVLPEACRGPHVAFAAPGAQMAVAALGAERFGSARGTSFAAPLVAGLLAASLQAPDAAAANLAVAALARTAVDAGAPGRDDVYGWGVVARSLRTDAATFMARGR
ncbi:MAG TPA: S8 family serine peptidase [Albitalea sp.]|nr:S8 family serine peptidase [Albitalea sp.]